MADQAEKRHRFTHLHLHTAYSLLDGAIRIPALMKHVRALGMDSVAMTDHGNMFGAVEFYKAAVKEGVKPIIGCEFYVAPGSRTEKQHVERLADGNNYHLVILAQNQTGYQNLIRLASRSYTEGFYRKPRIDYELLAQHSEGLVCLTACLGGEVQRKVVSGRQQEAARLAGHLREVFGRDRFFLEIQNHGLPEEMEAARGNIEIANQHDIELILTNDSHFLTRDDQQAQDILLRINQKKTIEDPLFFSFNSEFYVKSPEEMSRLFPELQQAMFNTQHVADMVDLKFDFGNPLLPHFEVPAGETLDSYLRKLAEQGLRRRYPEITPTIQKRFEFEYDTITRMDFAGYFLIVQDFINFARQSGVPVGPGRGSAAGSIVSYALGITDIDPLRYNLLFERFLNPDRNEMPDIDVDFCAEKRDVVINYVREKYGDDRVGQIITYGTMAAKACLKDVARVLNIPFEEANSISKMFPDVLNISIDEAVQTSKELRSYSERGEEQRRLFAVARTLEGNVRHTGVHAAGVVIAPRPLEELIPLATVANRSGDKQASRVQVAQYDMKALTDVGLVKMDFLGLRNLTVLHRAVKNVKATRDLDIDLSDLPPDDPKAYALLQRGDVAGVFQLESSPGMREFVMRIKPNRFEDIVALIALFRPGPLQAGMAESFINRKKGREKVAYPHPDLKEVLEDTYGVIVYQEQVMLISRTIGGFSPAEADALRKAMGKKITEKMAEMRVKFQEGAAARGYEKRFAADLYDQMAQFASYGFNKSHSAAYAMIVYQTAYMKANFPTEYMCAVLDSEMDKTERLVPYINACRAMGIELLGPDINKSQANFSFVSEGVIRFGLGAIKNVGLPAVESVIRERDRLPERAFESFFQIMEHVDLRLCNRRALEAMVYAGAFASMNYTRKALLESMEMAFAHGQKQQADRQAGQSSLFGTMAISPGSAEPIPRGDNVSEISESEILVREKEVLGFYLSGHPLKRFERTLRRIRSVPIGGLQQLASGSRVEIAGVITDHSIRLTRAKKEMCRLLIQDLSESIEAVIFPTAYEKMKQNLVQDVPLFISGILEKKEDTGTPQLIVNKLSPLNHDVLEERQEKSLHLRLDSSALDSGALGKLQTILKSARGNLTVFFHLDRGSKPGEKDSMVIRAHETFRVHYSKDLTERLSHIKQVREIYLSVGEKISRLYPEQSTAGAFPEPAFSSANPTG
ncbi:MAG: DNA polymerase III subunit alpha [Spirochaetales bacterium]|nr:DNA polymerase III subunit alpha [Spirochaetales bacterium]